MANTAITIKNFYESIGKEIPARIDSARNAIVFNDIISTTKHGKKSFWRIIVAFPENVLINKGHFDMKDSDFNKLNIVVKRFVETGLIDGKIKDSSETLYNSGKNIGKVNETNAFTQAIRDSLGMYTKQFRKAISGIEQVSTNTTKISTSQLPITLHPLPMLVKMEGKAKKVSLENFYETSKGSISIQPKLNGARCMTHLHQINDNNTNYEVCMYSRSGIAHKSMGKLKEIIGKIFSKIPSNIVNILGLYLDGEIYSHGESLEVITGQMRKQSEESGADLEYYLYDIYLSDNPKLTYNQRKEILDLLKPIIESITDKIKILQTFSTDKCEDFEEAKDLIYNYYNSFLKENYEGAILRNNNAVYELGTGGYHSSNIIKLKPLYDNEYKIVGFLNGKGKSLGTFTWVVETVNKLNNEIVKFNVEHKGLTIEQRKKIFNKFNEIEPNGKSFFDNNIKGKLLKVEYFSLSNKGLPTLAKAVCVREEDNPNEYPVWANLVKSTLSN